MSIKEEGGGDQRVDVDPGGETYAAASEMMEHE